MKNFKSVLQSAKYLGIKNQNFLDKLFERFKLEKMMDIRNEK